VSSRHLAASLVRLGKAKAPGVAPDVLADHVHAVEPLQVFDQDPPAVDEDRVIDGVRRNAQAFRDAGVGQVLADEAVQRPPQATVGDLRPRLSRARGVLTPDRARSRCTGSGGP